MDDSVVITGAGLICSIGKSAHEAWDGLLSGRHGIRPIEGFEIRGFDCQYAAQVDGIDPSDIGIHPKDARIMDKHSFMLLKCARDAFIASRLDHTPIEKEDIGFFAGLGMVDYKIEDLMPAIVKSMSEQGELDYDAFYSEAYREIYPLWPLSMLNNISFCQVAIHLDIRGENIVFSPHADSGAQALVEGMKTVVGQRSRVVLAGGLSEKVSPISLARGHVFGILNTTEKNGAMLCRPFASERKGTILGEGCGVLALELRSSADKRGIPYSTKITGYGFACDSRQDNEGATSKAIACGNATIGPEKLSKLEAKAASVGVEVNDILLASSYRMVDIWNRMHGKSSNKVRVMAIVNVSPKGFRQVVSNQMSWISPTTWPKDRADQAKLLKKLRSHTLSAAMNRITFSLIYFWYFNTLLPPVVYRQIFRLLVLLRTHVDSIFLTNIGIVWPKVGSDEPAVTHIGKARIVNITGSPPVVTPWRLGFGVNTYNRTLNISLTYRPAMFSREEIQQFLDLYVEEVMNYQVGVRG